jgi:hypothetical protein
MENTTVIFKVDFGDTAQKAVDLTNKIKELAEQIKLVKNQVGFNSKEVKQLEAALKANQTQLTEYNKTLEAGVKIQEAQEGSLKALKTQRTQELKAYDELSKAQREDLEIGGKQRALIADLDKQIKDLQAELKNYGKTVNSNVDAEKKAVDSLDTMKLQLKEQRKAYSELSKAERENVDIGVKQAKNIRELQQEIKELELGLGNTAVNVGNYQESIEKAFDNTVVGDRLKGIRDSLGQLSTGFGGLGQAAKGAGGGIQGIGTATKIGFGAILIIAEVVIQLFKQMSENFEPFRVILAQVTGVWKAWASSVIEFYYTLYEAIKAPTKAFELFSGFLSKAVDDIGNAANASGELEKRTIAIEKAQRKVNLATAQLSAEVEKQEKIADNQAVSFADRQAAIEKALKAEQVRGDAVLKLEKEKLSIIEGRLKLEPRSKQLLDEQADAQVAIIELQGQQASKIQDLQNKYAELNRSRKDQELSILETAKNGELEATNNVAKQYKIRLELLKIAKQKELNAESISAEDRKRIEADFLVKKQSLRRQFTTQALSEALEATVTELEAALVNTQEFTDQAYKLQVQAIDARLKVELNAINQEEISQKLKLAKINLATQNSLNERLTLNAQYQEKIQAQLDQAESEDLARANKELQIENDLLLSKQRANKLNLELTAQDELLSLTERTAAKIELLELEREQLLEQENITAEERAAINRKYDVEIAKEREVINQYSVNTTLQQFQGLTQGLTSIFEQAKQVELNQAGDSAEKRAAIEKKYAERVRAIRLFEVATSTAAAIVKTLAEPTLPFPANVITASLIGASGAVQLAAVASQKFAGGGYTGSGYGSPDETGYKPAGIVHEGEYVVPKRVVNSNPALMATLEGKRLGKYADGGLVNNSISSGAQAFNYDKLAQSIAKIRVVTEVQAFETAQTDRRTIINQATY